jgi:FAD/FMN-containing dehydrogenase
MKNELITKLQAVIGPESCLESEADKQPFLQEWRGRMQGKALAVMLPKTTLQVAELMRFCLQEKIAIVPQGGNTGLVGASVPEEARSIILSLKRMNAIRALEADDFSMVAEAGVILQKARDAAAAQNRLLAMTLASEGSATIGGLIATNAGGSFTVLYGNMREQVLGLEAVLPDGRIWNGLRSLRKNNSGYDLKQLLIGSEGTLGIITAATLKLRPLPTRVETALIGLASPAAALAALTFLRETTEDRLAAFELMPRLAIETACKGHEAPREPFAGACPWYALVEVHEGKATAENIMEAALEHLFQDGIVLDAAIAESAAQGKAFWHLREAIVEAQKQLGASLKHDLAVPVSRIPELIAQGSALAEKMIPGIRPYLFGHVGDGNIHFNLSQPGSMAKEAFIAEREAIAAALHDLALKLGGSISAEHGIGRFKRDEFHRTVSAVEFETMRSIKKTLDPDGLLNPGVIF